MYTLISINSVMVIGLMYNYFVMICDWMSINIKIIDVNSNNNKRAM